MKLFEASAKAPSYIFSTLMEISPKTKYKSGYK